MVWNSSSNLICNQIKNRTKIKRKELNEILKRNFYLFLLSLTDRLAHGQILTSSLLTFMSGKLSYNLTFPLSWIWTQVYSIIKKNISACWPRLGKGSLIKRRKTRLGEKWNKVSDVKQCLMHSWKKVMWFLGGGGMRGCSLYQMPMVRVSHAMKLKKAQEHYLPSDTPIFRKSFNLHSYPVHLCSYLMTIK